MSVPSAETGVVSMPSKHEHEQHPIAEPGGAREVLKSPETPVPTRTDSEPQQASTQPGDGGKSYVPSATVEYVEPSASSTEGKIPWKDQVLGYAKVARGKMLRKQGTTDVGNKILQGEILPQETRRSSSNE